MSLTRRTLGLAGLATLAVAASLTGCAATQADLSPAARASVAEVQAWLDDLHGLHANFLQTWPDGAVSEGIVLFDPPGRLRLDYAPHDRMVLIANAGRIVVTDASTGSVTRTHASASPIGLLLEEHIDLFGGNIRVNDVQQVPGRLQLTLTRADNPGAGQLTLVFDRTPSGLELTSLQALDAERRRTMFRLFDQTTHAAAPPAAFALPS